MRRVSDESAQRWFTFCNEVSMSSHIDFRSIAVESLATYPTSNFYFLLDHGALPGLHMQLSRNSVEWVSLFDFTKEESALAVAPILVQAGANGIVRAPRSLFEWIERNGTYTSSTIMLTSPLDIGTMKNRLVTRLDVRLSEEMEAMLRFFDPRVLESLTRILSVEQVNQFFSVAQEWEYMDRAGIPKKITAAFRELELLSAPMTLDQKQEFALLEASEVDQVLDLLRSNLPELMEKLSWPDQYTFISRQLVTAKQEGLDSVLELAVYAMMILSKGEAVKNGPSWRSFLAKLKRDDYDFEQVFS
jgi:hypothetical protein